MVTVSSGVQTPPSSIFAVSSCGASSDGSRTLGCVTSGFSPAETLTFSWTGDVTGKVDYPAMQSSGAYTAVSQVQVKNSDWEAQKSFTCQVQHPALSGAKTATMKRPDDSEPTIRLMEFGQSIICLIDNFYPPSLSITWKVDDREVKGLDWYKVQNAQGSFKTFSLLEGNQMTKDTKYTCEVTHKGKPHKKEGTFKAKFSLKINPPSAKDLFVQNKAIITCVITGDDKKEVEAATVLWTVGGQTRASTATDNVKETTAPFTKSSNLTLDESEWFKGYEVKCSTERDKTPFSEKIKVEKGGERPSVLFYKPENNVRDSDKVSLLCEVSSSKLGDVYIMWQKNNDPYMEGSSTVRINANTVLSYLTLSGTEYNNTSNKFTCAAKDANMKNDTAPTTAVTSKKEPSAPDPGLYMDCVKDITGEDDYNSLWSTASSFIFLFLFTIVYSTVLSLSKMK
ncbi:hypothetical protein AMEX_G22070 [Astyanax mexicanus]|uniref:Ig-like domain-containing protein n=1 Tax=Astyanax mexicanus TaxID=7994 RepID=A0A8T2KYJ9_ASTMX|nr:hypothetical protein AMEX_G22070 [Astyanax mexicanus]